MIRRAVLALCVLSAPVWASDGLRVKDGDGLELDGRDVRLWGVDAFELEQSCSANGQVYPCGRTAADQLHAFTDGQAVRCELVNVDRYGRDVSRCSVNGEDLAALMVRAGWALDWPRYSKRRYAAEQVEAEQARRGAHAGAFVAPWDWRRTH